MSGLLNNLLEKGYFPDFIDTTRTYDINNENGTCTNNIFSKTESITTKTFKLMIHIRDHYLLFIDIKISEKKRLHLGGDV